MGKILIIISGFKLKFEEMESNTVKRAKGIGSLS